MVVGIASVAGDIASNEGVRQRACDLGQRLVAGWDMSILQFAGFHPPLPRSGVSYTSGYSLNSRSASIIASRFSTGVRGWTL